MQDVTGTIQMFDKLHNSTLIVEFISFSDPFVKEDDPHTTVEERQFLQPFVEKIKIELGGLEDRGIWFERRLGTDFLGRTHTLHRPQGNAPFVLLLVDVAVT